MLPNNQGNHGITPLKSALSPPDPASAVTEQVAKAAAAAAKKNRKSVDAELQSVDHTNANLMAACVWGITQRYL